MKSFISSLALVVVAASPSGGVAESSPPDLSFARDVLADLSAALGHPDRARLRADWTAALACTADLEGDSPGLVDESACATTTAGEGGDACVWCDASALIGTGVCVGPDLQSKAGPLWGAVCGAAADGGALEDPEVAAPAPPAEDAVPAALGDSLSDVVRCSLDDAMSVVADEEACAARKDAAGESCVWCDVSFLGSGACTSSSMKTTIGFLCSSATKEEQTLAKKGVHLRGAPDEAVFEDHL